MTGFGTIFHQRKFSMHQSISIVFSMAMGTIRNHCPRQLTSTRMARRSVTSFSKIFQNSRLASLPRPVNRPKKENELNQQISRHLNVIPKLKSVPTHQVITTTPASNHRADYGLKRSMPAPLKSRYIVMNRLDTPFGFTDYEPGSSKALVLKRLQSLKTSPSPIPRKGDRSFPELSPLFYGATHQPLTAYKTSGINRDQFKQWLKKENLKPDSSSFNKFAQSKGSYDSSPVATGGFSYTLPGTLFNTRDNGFTNQVKVPGRVLSRNGKLIASSGMIASSESGTFTDVNKTVTTHRDVYPMVVDRMRVNHLGEVNMFLKQHREQQTKLSIEKRKSTGRLVEPARPQGDEQNKKSVDKYYDMIKNSLYF